ncbi:ribokinase-like domain-containing protein [Anopheles sinensis]|uniref:Ribokinase-like domain-containing protein n=1 Tax=Anopheles sinensis TaxID=74873 RepID=A0A084WBZ6_ANOSI|nr:ribokinase-like domain-containing protein [Anopheles sinensis]
MCQPSDWCPGCSRVPFMNHTQVSGNGTFEDCVQAAVHAAVRSVVHAGTFNIEPAVRKPTTTTRTHSQAAASARECVPCFRAPKDGANASPLFQPSRTTLKAMRGRFGGFEVYNNCREFSVPACNSVRLNEA